MPRFEYGRLKITRKTLLWASAAVLVMTSQALSETILLRCESQVCDRSGCDDAMVSVDLSKGIVQFNPPSGGLFKDGDTYVNTVPDGTFNSTPFYPGCTVRQWVKITDSEIFFGAKAAKNVGTERACVESTRGTVVHIDRLSGIMVAAWAAIDVEAIKLDDTWLRKYQCRKASAAERF